MAANLDVEKGLLELLRRKVDLKHRDFIAGIDQKRTNQEPAVALASNKNNCTRFLPCGPA